MIISSPLPLSQVPLCYFCSLAVPIGSSLPYVTICSGFSIPCNRNNSFSCVTVFEPFSHFVRNDFVIPLYSSERPGDLLSVSPLRSHRVWVFNEIWVPLTMGHLSLRTGSCLRHLCVPQEEGSVICTRSTLMTVAWFDFNLIP